MTPSNLCAAGDGAGAHDGVEDVAVEDVVAAGAAPHHLLPLHGVQLLCVKRENLDVLILRTIFFLHISTT